LTVIHTLSSTSTPTASSRQSLLTFYRTSHQRHLTSFPTRRYSDILVNMANLLGMTLENVRLFEEVATVRRQWEYTFDSIGDPILVHDAQGRILRSNQRLRQLLGREREAMVGWSEIGRAHV